MTNHTPPIDDDETVPASAVRELAETFDYYGRGYITGREAAKKTRQLLEGNDD